MRILLVVAITSWLGVTAMDDTIAPHHRSSFSHIGARDQLTDVLVLDSLSGAKAGEPAMIQEAFRRANAMLTSQCFHDELLHATMTETNDDSPDVVFNSLTDSSLRLSVDIYDGSWIADHIFHTVGKEIYPDSTTVHMNRHFVKSASDAASNLLHEAAHSRGFRHDENKATSVPYTLNFIYERCEPKVIP